MMGRTVAENPPECCPSGAEEGAVSLPHAARIQNTSAQLERNKPRRPKQWVPGEICVSSSKSAASVRDVNRRAPTGPWVRLFELGGDLEKGGLVAESACQLHIDG